MTLLAVRSLTKAFGGVRAADEVSFDIARGEFLALIGPNGAGKSTCFNMINGQLAPDSGEILLDGEDVAGLAPREVWRRGVGRTFQVAATFASMTVVENVQMALISYATRPIVSGSRRRRGIASARSDCWRRSACVRPPTGRAASSPMATSSASSLPSRSPTSPSFC